MNSDANIVIVGSGVAGGLIAELLLNAGVPGIVMLEAGPPVKMRDSRAWLDAVMNGTVPYGDLYDQEGEYTSSGATPWQITGGRLFGRGGSTIHWGGWCPRFMPEDFQLGSNTGIGIDWPFTYDDLEPYYVKAESYLQVGGKQFPGQRDWRSAPYPLAAPEYPLTTDPIIHAMEASDISFQHLPLSRNTVSINGQPQCRTTGTCQYCPLGARFTGDQPLDRLAAHNHFRLITGAAARRILMSSKSSVSGIEYLDRASGRLFTISAEAVFVCAGALETPKLLLASRNSDWPNGIANDHDLVGRFLVANPYLFCVGSADSNPLRLQQELNFPSLCSRNWDTHAEQEHGKFLMNMSYGSPLLNPATMMFAGATAAEIRNATTGKVTYQLQGAISPLPYRENQVSLGEGMTRFGLPKTVIATPTPMTPAATIDLNLERTRTLMSRMGFAVSASGAYPQRGDHAASTCRMASSPESGVVDPTMRAYGTKNLFIASNAILPTIGAANLTLTLVATIMKSMDSILQEKGFSIR